MKFPLQIRCIGRLQEGWHKQAIHMYTTRCAPYLKIEILELPEGHGQSSKPDIAKTLSNEAVSLLKNLPKDATCIALDEHGDLVTSQNLANLLSGTHSKFDICNSKFVFFIGGSWGLDKSVLDFCDKTISLGKITLPHALARIVLMEQIYRSMMILNGKSQYHK